jgi:cytochrome c553
MFCFALALFISTIAMSFVVSETKPRYKNLKVMPKNTTKEQMDSVMKSFTVALGVKCNFCHEFNQEQKAMDFASDANHHKGIARDMMKMTQRLNRKYFDVNDSKSLTASLEVTCYTCHNGKADPRKGPELAQQSQQQNSDTTKRQQ